MDLSVILPLYNGGQYIRDAVLSVEEMNKDMSLEILIIDDGSTDDSLSVAQALSNEFSNIVVLTKQNGGIASAREFGVKNCNGKFITFLDQDDRVLSGYLPFIKRMEDEQADMLMSDPFLLSHGVIQKANKIKEDRLFEHDDCVDMGKMLFCPEVFTPVDAVERHLISVTSSVWNCIFSKQFVVNNNLHFQSNVRYEDDWVFIGESLGCCSRMIVTSNSFYCWTINNDSESHTTKYVHDMFAKRKNHKDVLMKLVKRMGANEPQLHDFEHILDAQTVIVCGKNAMLLPLKDYRSEIKKIKFYGDLGQYCDFKVGKLSSLYLCLWNRGWYNSAYAVNRIVRSLG